MFIRHYQLKNRKNKKIRGPIFVCDISPKIKKQIAKEIFLIRDENILNGPRGKKYVCPHKNNPCFINYIELEYGQPN